MSRAHLEDIYRRASYIIHSPDADIHLRIGQPSAELDALLAAHEAQTWAFITAWNPGSFRLPPSENERNNIDMRDRLLRMGYSSIIPGVGTGEDGWKEESFFIPGIPVGTALELGRFYRQQAIVVGRRGAAPELLWC